jgi:ABC-type dipeptide/oligopeptide/nickel transport system permease subunit
MLETLGEDFILTARAKGMRDRTIVRRHAFRNAMLPVITLVALSLGYIVAGSILIETVFSWPGVGLLVSRSVERRVWRAPGHLPGAHDVGRVLQLRRRPVVLQARPEDHHVSVALGHEPGVVAETSARRLRTAVWRLMKDRPSAVLGVVVLGLMILVAVFAPLIAPHGIHEKIGEPFSGRASSAARSGRRQHRHAQPLMRGGSSGRGSCHAGGDHDRRRSASW